jgi:hypothetical protein
MKTRDCEDCRFLKWSEYRGPSRPITYRCTKGHKPRMYWHPDPHIAFEVKRRCADYKSNTTGEAALPARKDA